ncbi:hypothetical protein [Streptomyces sp. NBC_00878]|uniref:hypothetical protein n=1 Tax=Streptomyces sp. NBC_00878 TaxID=2975854 RepID=UPI00225670AA|nr:hypothetical protein [Streptomyces sp. NBC_00878]MCX4911844.1 hypothetical protein [Streptomyces sp. NBC_00878]
MERYINRRPGERRVQPEISEQHIRPLAADLATITDPSAATTELLAVLREAQRAFGGGDGGQA